MRTAEEYRALAEREERGCLSADFGGRLACGDPRCRACRLAAALREAADHAEPTPEALEAWAEWFDDPNKSPSMAVDVTEMMAASHKSGNYRYTPGYLLREIARRLRAAREE